MRDASETDETRATGGTARATTTQNEGTVETSEPEDVGGALDAIAQESRRILSAVEETLYAELTAEIDQAKRSGAKDMGAMLAQLRQKRRSLMTAARQRVQQEKEGERRTIRRQAKRRHGKRSTKPSVPRPS